MQPLVTGWLWTSCPLTLSTITDEAPQVQSSDRFAGAEAAVNKRTMAAHAISKKRPLFMPLQRSMA
jgi:hypothetical protein